MGRSDADAVSIGEPPQELTRRRGTLHATPGRADEDRRLAQEVYRPHVGHAVQDDRGDMVGHLGCQQLGHRPRVNAVRHHVRGHKAHHGRALRITAEHHLSLRAAVAMDSTCALASRMPSRPMDHRMDVERLRPDARAQFSAGSWKRLQKVKRAVDPQNLFPRANRPTPPKTLTAGTQPAAASTRATTPRGARPKSGRSTKRVRKFRRAITVSRSTFAAPVPSVGVHSAAPLRDTAAQ